MASTTITEVKSFLETGDIPTEGQFVKVIDTLRGKFNPLTNYLAADEQAVLWTDNNWYLVVADTAAGETPATDPDKFYPISNNVWTADITQGGGTANFTVTLPGGIDAFSEGVLYIFNVGTVTNATGAVTINPGSGAITVKQSDGTTAAATQDFDSGRYYPMIYNGTVLISLSSSSSSSSTLVSFRKSLTSAQIRTLFSVPIDITELPAPGVGYAWEILSACFIFTFNTTSFDVGDAIYIKTETGNGALFYLDGLTNFSASTSLNMIRLNSTAPGQIDIIENKKMLLTADADSSVGDGTIIIYGTARKVKL